ncbi:MAG: hypothetical protein Q8R98_17725 [Rubrivivax sp.]|nr:hypothetical protein [Rubrivivax sp.]MDP3613681.1 hypothetical protein [Rubrivivax sp.]
MRAAYRRYVDARCLPTPDGEYTPEALEEMQAAMLDALRAEGPLPDEMRLHLGFAFEYVCAGLADQLLTPIKRPGGREAPIAKSAQQGAIRYLRWCEDGRIEDSSPVRTVAQAFDVVERVVRRWRAAWKDRETPALHEDFGADSVVAFMKADGRVYRRFVKKPEARRPR